ncbi:nucleotidyl transferase AbiEii/AbiGii toxin family protein [Bradyrhizobium sp. USDA 4486]
MKDGSGRWLPSRWEDLLQKALVALDSREGGAGPWTFGGGTALAQILAHRISYDVDIFLFKYRLEEPRTEHEPGHEVALRWLAMAGQVPEAHPARRR